MRRLDEILRTLILDNSSKGHVCGVGVNSVERQENLLPIDLESFKKIVKLFNSTGTIVILMFLENHPNTTHTCQKGHLE